jgi:hypothetical protein
VAPTKLEEAHNTHSKKVTSSLESKEALKNSVLGVYRISVSIFDPSHWAWAGLASLSIDDWQTKPNKGSLLRLVRDTRYNHGHDHETREHSII